ncbi:hypothetical protein [Dokdonia sp. Asnod1-B02]|uniref:hypothetical protein n=1 Tax=Dokdonia sp. Asnod1-B02 TaxID=3160573 RepID=UPI00386FF53B
MKTCKFLTFLLLGGFLMLSCGGETKGTPHTDDHDEEPLAVPSSIITVQEAETLFKNYRENRISLIEKAQNISKNGESLDTIDANYVRATTSLSIKYDDLKKYIEFIEEQAEKADTPITGLRIYLGQYGPKEGKNANTETIFLNPLMKYSGSNGDITNDVAFAVKDINGTATAVPVGDIIKEESRSRGKSNLEMSIQSSIQSLAGNTWPRRPPPPKPNDPDYQ